MHQHLTYLHIKLVIKYQVNQTRVIQLYWLNQNVQYLKPKDIIWQYCIWTVHNSDHLLICWNPTLNLNNSLSNSSRSEINTNLMITQEEMLQSLPAMIKLLFYSALNTKNMTTFWKQWKLSLTQEWNTTSLMTTSIFLIINYWLDYLNHIKLEKLSYLMKILIYQSFGMNKVISTFSFLWEIENMTPSSLRMYQFIHTTQKNKFHNIYT